MKGAVALAGFAAVWTGADALQLMHAVEPRAGSRARLDGVHMAEQPVAKASETTKKNQRRAIMSKDNYKRGGAPFERAIHTDVTEKMSSQFAGELVNKMKESSFRELVVGEGNRAITFVLAKEFGFCWGVERSIELAWAARDAYPDKKMHITNELIHNPGVNDLLQVRVLALG